MNAQNLIGAQIDQLREELEEVIKNPHAYCYIIQFKLNCSFKVKNLKENDDGFKISEHDLELRGPGEILEVNNLAILNLSL